ncbi:hypothetical protein E4U41_003158 [Claviceps citrina]|nr:hypothetical protein E4U41_003158 [Claviceps citrina]
MSSTSAAGPSQVPETYLKYMKNPDVDFEIIKSKSMCGKFHDSVWGFVIYRCVKGKPGAWEELLQALRDKIQKDLRFYIQEDMLLCHDLHVVDDETLYGATTDQVRERFKSWVPGSLKDRLLPHANDQEEEPDWIRAMTAPRYEYCLFVDDICLESLEHPGVDTPVVKLLHKNWESPYPPHKRNYTIHPPYHDGATRYEEEDVGWMYMPLHDYIYKYELLSKGDWDTIYVRPPFIDGTEIPSERIGHWRLESVSKSKKA